MEKYGAKLAFVFALLVFGIASAGGVRPISAQVIACGGYDNAGCTTDTAKRCVKRTICGIRIGNPPGLVTCCMEWVETTFYTYYPDVQ